MKTTVLFLLALSNPVISFCQQIPPCGLEKLMESVDRDAYYEKINRLIREYENVIASNSRSNVTITIPVVFHVIYNDSAQNIPDSMILQQLDIMNNDFQRKNADTTNTPVSFQSIASGMDVEFCLAKQTSSGQATDGIIRVFTSKASFASPVSYNVPDPVKRTSMGGSDSWDPTSYLNIWICNLTGSTAYSAPPGNFMPQDDGVVCNYRHVGISNNYPYGKGRSIVHEIGHFFCLKHIWGDDNGACSGTDYINDTPNQANFSANCPSFPHTDNCSSSSPGVMFMNYMDYSEDGCRNIFTKGQTTYMQSCINAIWSTIFNSKGCDPPGVFVQEFYSSENIRMRYDHNILTIISRKEGIESIGIYNSGGQLVKYALPDNSVNEINITMPHASHGVYIANVFMKGSSMPARKKLVLF